jgi:hypothetical protein
MKWIDRISVETMAGVAAITALVMYVLLVAAILGK